MFQLLPVQVRDPEAQPHLPTGTLAKNLAHLEWWVYILYYIGIFPLINKLPLLEDFIKN